MYIECHLIFSTSCYREWWWL